MRVGKTPQAILAADKVGADSILVLCPAVACEHWRREFAKWSPNRAPAVVLSSAPWHTWPSIAIASYDMARRHQAMLMSRVWDVFIPDECHYAKNPAAARTRLVYGKKGLATRACYTWPLSGTPAPRHGGELWPMLRAFGATGMRDLEFIDYFCYSADDGRVLGTKAERIPELRALLAPIMLRRTIKDVASELPAIGYELMQVAPKVPAGLRLETNLRLLSSNAPADPVALARWIEQNAEHLAEWRIAVAMMKVEPLAADILESLDARLYDQTVVFGHHTEPLRAVADRLRAAGVRVELLTGQTSAAERSRIRDRFALGITQVVVANIIAAGTAIDLSAASHGYFLELSWVPGDNVQAAHRLVSLDKAAPVTYDVVSWSGSFDDRIQSTLARRVRELSQLM
jgi:SNF2 family DNA or RNA helicase